MTRQNVLTTTYRNAQLNLSRLNNMSLPTAYLLLVTSTSTLSFIPTKASPRLAGKRQLSLPVIISTTDRHLSLSLTVQGVIGRNNPPFTICYVYLPSFC